ncbi:MAG TPA: NAD(P)-binding domain-containing protein [Candidatus Limnocylindrales bacterium]|nr:NAD(P)-binding domain-containing protein [Candidatus Limnocylindrales bacterium]
MAEVAERPYPPGDYPVVVVGSGPGGLQLVYRLSRLGVPHAAISADPAPGGMFRRFPFFQRLLSWTKPYAPAERGSRAYHWYDWNSLLAEEPEHRSLMPTLMDGTSSFPSRPEMEQNLALFAERTGIVVRYDCRWESTRREADRFVLVTSDGEYRCQVLVLAVGVAEPYKPPTPGFEEVPHYAETRNAESYAGKRLFLVGKENSSFELATGLLPWARQIVLASPRPAQLSVNTNSLVGVRARYVQPWEDSVLGGGVFMMNASIERIVRHGQGYRVHTRRSEGGAALMVDVDEVIAATGWTCPLRDLPSLGVATVGRSQLPAQTAYWESASLPGVYFAGTITQGSGGLKKYGIPSNSGAVQGYRYNSWVLGGHIAEKHFGIERPRPAIAPADLVPFLLDEVTTAPELWNQRAYLARVVSVDPEQGVRDEGIEPLAHFVDAPGGDAIAVAVESNDQAVIRPAIYVRRAGRVDEVLMEPDPLNDFRTPAHRKQLEGLLAGLGLR